ncbi:hypothetical protein Taro_027742 [Colocasia esculenta]|uniref:Uncharacterized protein n=1 Tax=Colocasia esculenta TaxID=4460 RepID=A0A843VPN7_COLES|nr:hypothetical protein [Colocasia esculenta]
MRGLQLRRLAGAVPERRKEAVGIGSHELQRVPGAAQGLRRGPARCGPACSGSRVPRRRATPPSSSPSSSAEPASSPSSPASPTATAPSLLVEAVGRVVNPVGGAMELLQTGNWYLCQTAVESVLSGGALRPLPAPDEGPRLRTTSAPACEEDEDGVARCRPVELELCLTASPAAAQPRPGTPQSEGSVMTSADRGVPASTAAWSQQQPQQPRVLNLFV